MIFVVLSGSLRVNSLANARHFSHWVTRLKPRWACTHPHPASCINTLVVPGYPYSLCTQKCIQGACWIDNNYLHVLETTQNLRVMEVGAQFPVKAGQQLCRTCAASKYKGKSCSAGCGLNSCSPRVRASKATGSADS